MPSARRFTSCSPAMPPFPGGSLAEKILKHQTAEPRSILEERPGAPRDLVKICQKMMAKNPADRYQTAAEVAAVLAAWRPPKKVLKAVALDEEEPNQDGAFDLAALTASQRTGAVKPDSGKAILGKSLQCREKGPAKSEASKPGAEAPPVVWYRRPVVLWTGGAVLAILGIVLGAVLMNLNSEPPAEQKPPEKPQAAGAAAAAAPKSNKPVAKGNDDNLVIPELIPLNGGNKPKPPVKPPSKPSGNGGKPGEPVKVALVPPKEPTPKPAETPTPKPAETPTAKPTEPPPPKPPEPPPPKPEIKSPLGELPKVVDLPAAENTGPFAVGKISCAVRRRMAVGPGRRRRGLQELPALDPQARAPGKGPRAGQAELAGGAERDQCGGRKQEQATTRGDVLPRRRHADVPMAAGRRAAGDRRPRYCALAVKVGDDKKTVGLIKPKTVKPLVIDLRNRLCFVAWSWTTCRKASYGWKSSSWKAPRLSPRTSPSILPKPLPPKSARQPRSDDEVASQQGGFSTHARGE